MLGLGNTALQQTNKQQFYNQGSLSFDGTDQDVLLDSFANDVLSGAIRANTTSFSISAWFRVGAVSATVTIFRAMAGTDTNNMVNLFYHNGSTQMGFTTKFGGTANQVRSGNTDFKDDGLWHHVVGTVDASTDETVLWVDGAKQQDVEEGIGTLSAGITKASIGSNTGGGSFYLGEIDEVAMWSRKITDSEIAILYNDAGLPDDKAIEIKNHPLLYAECIAHFRFEEKKGDFAINEFGEIATIRNEPTYSRLHP